MTKHESNTELTPIKPLRSEADIGTVTREDAEAAVRTLMEWIGENPNREGLLGTPSRVARAYRELFSGYGDDPKEILRRTFEEVDGYDEMVVLRDIRIASHCEHHILPIIGRAHVAYLPNRRVIGISKLARIVDIYARRLQIQEKLTVQIADTIDEGDLAVIADELLEAYEGDKDSRDDWSSTYAEGLDLLGMKYEYKLLCPRLFS